MKNGERIAIEAIPFLPILEFQDMIISEVKRDKRIASLFATPDSKLFAILANSNEGDLKVISTSVKNSYPTLTPLCKQVHLFEREIFEQHQIMPEGHPWLKPVRSLYNNFFQIEGRELHEVAVGPVHAGIIEPGHFRFQCNGEKVLHLEIALGYQHRGIEKALIQGPNERTIHYMETAAGDTSIGHTIAYAQLIEALSLVEVPARAGYIRGIALELERLANHTGDLGALASDIGFLPTASYCGRLRGDFLNMTAEICGNRFGRGLICPGGVEYDIGKEMSEKLLINLNKTLKDTLQAANLLWSSSSVVNRFEKIGVLKSDMCQELGVVGVALRASGIKRDVRADFGLGIYKEIPIPISIHAGGDVYARAFVRYLEIEKSAAYIQYLLKNLPAGDISVPSKMLEKNSLAISLVEGWRGEICHVAMTDEKGKFFHYKIVDPSFHNWMGLAIAMRGEEISNFPICNKSFNLSYSGHDL